MVLLREGGLTMSIQRTGTAAPSRDTSGGPVLYKVEYMAYPGEPEIIPVTRGSIWNYMIKRCEIDKRNLGDKVSMKFAGRLPATSGLEFVRHPDEAGHPWPIDQVDGLVVPTLRAFVNDINAELESIPSEQGKNKALRHLLGYNVGVTTLRHMDTTAAHYGCPA